MGTDSSSKCQDQGAAVGERNYVQIQAGRKVVPTELGITLVRGYQLIDQELCSPQVTYFLRRTSLSSSQLHLLNRQCGL